MKATFTDFITENPNCSKFASTPSAQQLFDFLSRDEIIIAMIDAVENDKPALSGCAKELEAFYDALPQPKPNLADSFPRTAVGRMVKTVLAPFGYRAVKQKALSPSLALAYFSSASCYAKTAPATMQVVKTVQEIRKDF